MSGIDPFNEALRKFAERVSNETLFSKESEGLTELLVLGYMAKMNPRSFGLQLFLYGKKSNVLEIVKQLQQISEDARKNV